jgi:hypothetical protein
MLEYLRYCQLNFPMPMSATTTETTAAFYQEIAHLEAKISLLKQRYQQVQDDDATWTALQERQQVVAARGQSLAGQQELQEIADLEEKLENQLLTTLEQVLESHQTGAAWQHLFQDLFWNAVRFGGLGLLTGWGLKTWLS